MSNSTTGERSSKRAQRWAAVADAAAAACSSSTGDCLSAVLISRGADVRYLSGFTGSSAWLLLDREMGPPRLLTDARYREQAARETGDCEIVVGEGGLSASLRRLLERREVVVGFDASDLSVSTFRALRRDISAVQWVPLEAPVAAARSTKSAVEHEYLAAAVALTEEAFQEVVDGGLVGRTELEAAGLLDLACRRRGAERMAFETIVACGERTALPHARPTSRLIGGAAAESVLIDFGCVLNGYCSDMTRVGWVGSEPEADWLAAHSAVAAAQEAAMGAIADDVLAADVDEVARARLREEGLAEAFVHGLGHGVGLEIHEPPRLTARSDDRLREGMVFTVEPGVYHPGRWGIRIENTVVVEEAGARSLNRLPVGPFAP